MALSDPQTSLNQVINATFYDGMFAQQHAIRVRIGECGLHFTMADRSEHYWAYDDIIINETPRDGLPAHLSSKRNKDAQLELRAADFDLLRPRLRTSSINYTLISMIAGLIGFIALLVFLIVPTITPTIAALVPFPWQKALGKHVLNSVIDDHATCTSGAAHDILTSAVNSLRARNTMPPLNITIVDMKQANAFALPGGYVIMTSEFIKTAQSPEEVIGVMAHEVGHLAHNHSMEQMVHHLGIAAIIEIVTGGGGTVIYSLVNIYNLRYSRDKEREADLYAAQTMTNSSYNVADMANYFARMRAQDSEGDADDYDITTWINTHPAHDERMTFFRTYPAPATPRAIMSASAWHDLHSLKGCNKIIGK